MSAPRAAGGLARANAGCEVAVAEKLAAALERVARACEAPERAIAYRMAIPAIARDLLVMRRVEAHRCRAADIHGATGSIPATLRKLEALAGLPWKQGRGLFETAIGRGGLPLALRVRFIALAADAAQLAAEIEAAIPPAPEQRGRPPAEASHAIAARLYQETERLAGRTPGRSVTGGVDQAARERGLFVTLVREVFAALGVLASPEEAARTAIEAARGMGKTKIWTF